MIENKKEFNWRLFWNTRQEFVLAILFFVLSFMIFSAGTISQIGPIKDALSNLKEKSEEVERFENKANQLTELASNPEFKKSSEIDKVLPSYKPLLEVLTNLNNVANSSEVIIKNFSLNPGEIATDSTKLKKTSKDNKYNYLDLDFSVSGPLWKVQNFMTLIEQTTPISTITNISLNRNIDEDKYAEAQATLLLRTFYFTQPIKTTITNPLPKIDDEDQKILANISNLRPNSLTEQKEIISGDRGDLFGIEKYSIEELQSKLLKETEARGEEASADGEIENSSLEGLFESIGIEDYQIIE